MTGIQAVMLQWSTKNGLVMESGKLVLFCSKCIRWETNRDMDWSLLHSCQVAIFRVWTFYYFLAVSLVLFLELPCLTAKAGQWVVMGFRGLRNPSLLYILIDHIFPFSDGQLYIPNCPLSFRGQANSVVLSIYLLYTHIGLPHLLVLHT